MAISALARDALPAAEALLAAACRFDRAAAVAEEKLFGAAPGAAAHPLGLWEGGELAAVAAVSGDRLRLLAVDPARRGRGLGSALLAACEALARQSGAAALHALDQPGNYLAPGIDERNAEGIGWLGRRGFAAAGSPRVNLLVALRGNPRLSDERQRAVAAAATARGYRLRRATLADEARLTAAIAAEFGGTWPFEVARALRRAEPGVHLAEQVSTSSRSGSGSGAASASGSGAASASGSESGSASASESESAPALCAFAAHDGNNAGLGWFGPAGTWPAHRGRGLGEALLLACLADVARTAEQAEIAWVGPEAFYEKSCGLAGRRIFRPMRKALR